MILSMFAKATLSGLLIAGSLTRLEEIQDLYSVRDITVSNNSCSKSLVIKKDEEPLVVWMGTDGTHYQNLLGWTINNAPEVNNLTTYVKTRDWSDKQCPYGIPINANTSVR